MSEAASALFSIADAGEFRFARFYSVCEEVPLGTPESPPIVSGVSDMHPSDFPNVGEMQLEYSEEFFELFVDHIEVYSRQEIGFALHCGLILKEMI